MELKIMLDADEQNLRFYRIQGETPEQIECLPFTELASLTFEGRCLRIGAAVLQELGENAPYDRLLSPELRSPMLSTETIVHHLIQCSVAERTSSYVEAIEQLLRSGRDSDGALKALAQWWPPIGERLRRFPPSSPDNAGDVQEDS